MLGTTKMRRKSIITNEEAREILYDLTAIDSSYVEKIKQLSRYIDSLEESSNQGSNIDGCEDAKGTFTNIVRARNKQVHSQEVHSQNLLFHKYHWTHTALLERHQGSEKSHLQMSRSDYEKVIKTIQIIFCKEDTFSTSTIQSQLMKAKNKLGKRLPLTQLYLCLRYLKAAGLLAKCGGSFYKYTGASDHHNFEKEASLVEKNYHSSADASKQI